MGAWDVGPFDNDDAADFCDQLDGTQPADRAALLRATLTAAAHETGYLDKLWANPAVAAAAIVAANRPGAPPVQSTYAPDFLTTGERLDLDEDIRQLAVRALDRVVGEQSEWRNLWSETASFAGALAAVAEIRAALVN